MAQMVQNEFRIQYCQKKKKGKREREREREREWYCTL
jgi:hypothetical protein